MNKTIFYNLFGSKRNQHFNIISLFREAYVETFRIGDFREFNGSFSWVKKGNIYVSNIMLKKDDFILTEMAEMKEKDDLDNDLNVLYSSLHIRNYKNDMISIKKDMICPKLLKDMYKKRDTDIVFCGCCKR